jgi:transcription antitermination factor NusG
VPLLKREPEIYPTDLFGAPPPGAEQATPAAWTQGIALWAPPEAPAPDAATIAAKPWRIAYTRSRQEKTLARHLLQSQVPYYLPQREHRVRAGDRWRIAHLPLFTGYVFFRADAQDRLTALKSNVIARLVDVPDGAELEGELRALWLLQLTGAPLVAHPYIAAGDEVEIVEGALRGYRGTVLREKGCSRLVVSITLLRQSVAAELDRETLAPARLRKVG